MSESDRSIVEWQRWMQVSIFTIPEFARIPEKKVLICWSIMQAVFAFPWFFSNLILLFKDWDSLSNDCQYPHKTTMIAMAFIIGALSSIIWCVVLKYVQMIRNNGAYRISHETFLLVTFAGMVVVTTVAFNVLNIIWITNETNSNCIELNSFKFLYVTIFLFWIPLSVVACLFILMFFKLFNSICFAWRHLGDEEEEELY